jgi:hypothetical protein
LEILTSVPRIPQRTVVFILSENRSGSQWLAYVLGSHQHAAYLGECRRWFTSPDHTACHFCAARGATDCEIFHGIQNTHRQGFFNFAFERTGRPILIDSSKRLDWAAHFVRDPRFQVKIIHLLRDPRGWFASERRRTPMSVPAAIRRWIRSNRQITDFIASYRLASHTAFYDDLAVDLERYFEPLCEFIGIPFETDALEYWNFDHHGPGGNGPAMNVTGESPRASIITGDDDFYRASFHRNFYDTRWLSQLNSIERTNIEQSPLIQRELAHHNREFSHFDRLVSSTETSRVEIADPV